MSSQLEYIRRAYNVPARRGTRVRYGEGEHAKEGVIVSGSGAHIRVRFDGEKDAKRLHPTWQVQYLPSEGKNGDRNA